MNNSVQEEANSDVEEETSNEKPSEDESSLAKKMNDINDLLDEEGRDEDEEKEEPIAAGMDEGGGEGELVKSEEPYERLHCKKCNFVTSAKSKKVRIDGLRRHVKSHHAGKSIIIAEEQTALEDVNLVLDDEEKDVSAENETKEGVTSIPHISHYRR